MIHRWQRRWSHGVGGRFGPGLFVRQLRLLVHQRVVMRAGLDERLWLRFLWHDVAKDGGVGQEHVLIRGADGGWRRRVRHRIRLDGHGCDGVVRVECVEEHEDIARAVHHAGARIAQHLGAHCQGLFEGAALDGHESGRLIRECLLACLELVLGVDDACLVVFLAFHQFPTRWFALCHFDDAAHENVAVAHDAADALLAIEHVS